MCVSYIYNVLYNTISCVYVTTYSAYMDVDMCYYYIYCAYTLYYCIVHTLCVQLDIFAFLLLLLL